MTSLLPDVVTCDLCGAPTCRRCQPDAISVCADDTAVHCADCGAECGPCRDEYVRERRAEVAEDIRLNGVV